MAFVIRTESSLPSSRTIVLPDTFSVKVTIDTSLSTYNPVKEEGGLNTVNITAPKQEGGLDDALVSSSNLNDGN